MKLFKKAAALFFCLALALSVMAVTALAAGEPFTVSLEEPVPKGDVNNNGYKEYEATTMSISYKVVLSGKAATVKAVQFDVALNGSSDENLNWGVPTFTVNSALELETQVYSAEGGRRFEIAVEGSGTGFTLENAESKVVIGTLTIPVTSPNANDKGSVSLGNVIVKDLADVERVAGAAGVAKAEIDPQYTVTIKVHQADENGIIGATSTPTNYTYNYNILAGLTGTIKDHPTWAYYTFTNYSKDTTVTSDNDADNKFTEADLASSATLTSALNDRSHYGNVTLVANYKTIKYPITVKNPGVNAAGVIDTSAELVGTGATYYYDIEGKLYSDENGANTATLAAASLNYYDFQNFVAVADSSNNNWAGTETYASGVGNVAQAMHGPVTFKAEYKAKVYTILLKEPDVNANGVIDPNAGAIDADEASITYTIEGLKGVGDNATESASIPATTKDAYTFNGTYTFAATTASDSEVGGWTGSPVTGAIGEGKHGNVTLTANFTPMSYTVTYALNGGTFTGDGATQPSGGSSTYSTTLSYTIEDTEKGGFSFGTPVRANYTFDGWTATAGEGAVSGTFTDMTSADKIDSPAGLWGNVTLTAVWTADGKFVTTAYKYAVTGDHLILFAVKEAPQSGGYTYQADENATAAPMFIVNAKYASLFVGDNALENLGDGKSWTIYGYIATSTGANIKNVAYSESAKIETIAYRGDMTQNGKIDAGDYGNVIALLGNSDQYANAQLEVRARLEADVAVTAKTDGMETDPEATGWFGTIDDVKTIMNAALNENFN